jgi:hypothetical protein
MASARRGQKPRIFQQKGSQMGLLEAFKQYVRDASPRGLLNPEVPIGGPTELAKGLLGFTPVVGDAISAYDAVQSARKGDYLGAALNGVGLLPFIPSVAGIVRNKTLEQAAKKYFGRTSVPSETGFLLDDATRLDLSGRHYGSGYIAQGDKYVPVKGQPDYLRGSRYVDHRELGDLAPEEGWDGLARFMNETGAVRYMPNTGISVVDTNMPSVDQITKAVQDFRRSGKPLYVDIDKLNGASRVSKEFQRPTVDEVMDFIKKNMRREAFNKD